MYQPKLLSAISASLLTLALSGLGTTVQAQCGPSEAVEASSWGPTISTEQLQKILTEKSTPVLDVRSAREYAIAHIPGSLNVYEKELDAILKAFPDKHKTLVLYCNGPFCHKVKRVASQLKVKGYDNILRYQLGMPVWRACGNTVQTDLEGFRYIHGGDKTAVFVDARPQAQHQASTLPGAVNIQPGEAEIANTDGRLPYTDKGTRIIVFADKPELARQVAEEIAHRAFWNSSYFGGSMEDLKTLKK